MLQLKLLKQELKLLLDLQLIQLAKLQQMVPSFSSTHFIN
jgi:hypothetical protein